MKELFRFNKETNSMNLDVTVKYTLRTTTMTINSHPKEEKPFLIRQEKQTSKNRIFKKFQVRAPLIRPTI